MTDLMNAATSSLDLYEKNKSLRMNFFFHEEAIRHLARLTRVYVINFLILKLIDKFIFKNLFLI